MEQGSSNVLPYVRIGDAVEKSITSIKDRMNGVKYGLDTRWKKLNKVIGGGIQWENQYCLAGISGSGKSSIANMLETDLFDLNPTEQFIVLNFNFEMPSYRQITRKFSNIMKKTVSELNSVDTCLSSKTFLELQQVKENIKKYNIFYFDVPGDNGQIYDTIMHFYKSYGSKYKLLNIFDHTRLINRKGEKDEFEVVVNASKMGMELKKKIGCTNLFLSQLNGNIESEKRLTNPRLHYPIRTDLYGNDAMFQSCDSVFVAHRPKMLGIEFYGPNKIPTDDLVAFHVLKNREGDPGMIRMKDVLEYNTIEEM